MKGGNSIQLDQIDYLMINKRYRNSILSIKTYQGAHTSSNQNLLITQVRTKLKRINHKTNRNTVDTNKLRNADIRRVKKDIKEVSKTLHSKEEYTEENIDTN